MCIGDTFSFLLFSSAGHAEEEGGRVVGCERQDH